MKSDWTQVQQTVRPSTPLYTGRALKLPTWHFHNFQRGRKKNV